MKKFKQMISEAGEQATFGKYAVGYTPSVLKKINAIIGKYVSEDQVDP